MCEQRQRCECCVYYEPTDDNAGLCLEYVEDVSDAWTEGEFCEEFEEL